MHSLGALLCWKSWGQPFPGLVCECIGVPGASLLGGSWSRCARGSDRARPGPHAPQRETCRVTLLPRSADLAPRHDYGPANGTTFRTAGGWCWPKRPGAVSLSPLYSLGAPRARDRNVEANKPPTFATMRPRRPRWESSWHRYKGPLSPSCLLYLRFGDEKGL